MLWFGVLPWALRERYLESATMKISMSTTAVGGALAIGLLTSAVGTQVALCGTLLLELPPASAGWSIKETADGATLQKHIPPRRAGDRGGGALIQIVAPVQFSSANDFTAGMGKLTAALPELAREHPLRLLRGVTINGDQMVVEERCCARRNDISMAETVVGIQGRGRQAFALLTELNLDGDDQKGVENEFERLIRSWRLDSGDKVFGLAGGKDDAGLEGIYTYFVSGVRPNGFGSMTMYAQNKIAMFDPSGLISHNIPPPGQNVAGFCRDKLFNCAIYRLLGGGVLRKPDRIEILEPSNVYGMFARHEEPLVRDGNDLKIGAMSYRRLPPLAKGTRLSGTWRYSYAAGGNSVGTSGAVAVERRLTLAADGRFSRTGWGGASVTSESGGAKTGVTSSHDLPAQAGRYEIDGYHLALTGDDGARESVSIFESQQGSDQMLTIDGGNYLKQ